MKTKSSALIIAIMFIGTGVNLYSIEPSNGINDESIGEPPASSRSLKNGPSDINQDIQTVNAEIKQTEQNFKTNYDNAMQAAQGISSSRAVQGSFMDRIDALKNDFYNILSEYKPGSQSWESFNAAGYHNINMNDRNDMMRFVNYAIAKRAQLDRINRSLIDLKWQMEGKDSYQGSTEYVRPSSYYYHYYDYYPYTYYSFPFSFQLGF